MSCRHNLANGTCIRCYPSNPFGREDKDRVDPGPEEDCGPNLEGPGATVALTPSSARTVVAVADGRFAVARVRDGVAGYEIDEARRFDTWAEGRAAAQASNDAAGVSSDEAWRIIESSMAASRAAGTRWTPH